MQALQADKCLLLQAAFMAGEQAERAWQLWQNEVQLDDIDVASQRALPQLHMNTSAATDSRVQGLYRRTWYSNTLLLEQIKPLFDRLAASDVRALAGKQSAAVVRARGCYPLECFHALVDESDLRRATHALREAGWVAPPATTLAMAALRGIVFARSGFFVQLACPPYSDAQFWQRVERVESDTGIFEVPGQVDQLLEAAAPRHTWHTTGLYQRLLESLLVVRTCQAEIDWPTLARISAAAELTLPLADVLQHLERDFGMSIPDGYVADLRSRLATPTQMREYRLKLASPSLWQRVRLSALEYRRLKDLSGTQKESFSPIDYLKIRWNVGDIKGIIKHIVAIAARPRRGSSLKR
jgi:hypothetical protein